MPSKPYTLEFRGDPAALPKLFADTDDMLAILFRQVNSLSTAKGSTGATGATGSMGLPGLDAESTLWEFPTAAPSISIPSLVAGSVLFAGPSGAIAQDNANFFWNDATNAAVFGNAVVLKWKNTTGTASAILTCLSDNNTYLDGHGTSGGWVIIRGGGINATITATDGRNVLIGLASAPIIGRSCMVFPVDIVPTDLATNTAGLYANDIGGTTEMFAINEAGVSVQLTGSGGSFNAAKVMQRVLLGI